LVDTQDELVSANNEIKRKNEAIAIIRAQLKEAHQSTTHLSLARDRLIETTKSIRSKVKAHYASADKLSTASRKLNYATQYLSLKMNEIAVISLDVIHLRDQLNEAALFTESLKEEFPERTKDLMAVQEANEVLHDMQLHTVACRSFARPG
jgi:chromosome segregation ATPase